MNETTIPRMLNYFYGILTGVYFPELTLDYSDFTAIATDTNGLLLKINNELAGGQIDSAATSTIATAINSMASATADDQLNRVKAAFYLTLASPSFFSQR